MLERRVVVKMPEMQDVIQSNIVYDAQSNVPLTMDVYYPSHLNPDTQLPAVIFVFGYSDAFILKRFGIKLKDAGQYVSWGQLVAASGLIAITYETTQPENDIYSVLDYVRRNAKTLQIDSDNIGLWACSANVPTALSVLVKVPEGLKCSILYYGLMFDQKGSDEIAALANRYGAAYPCHAQSVDDLPQEIYLFIVRAGKDNHQINQSIDHFVNKATKRNLPLTFMNYAEGQHAFDIGNDAAASQEIIRQTLAFVHQHLFNSIQDH